MLWNSFEYACEFGEHAALAGRIIMRNREAFGLSDHEVLNMAYDWSGKGLDFLYKRSWIAIRNPSMGNTFSIWMRPKPQQKLK